MKFLGKTPKKKRRTIVAVSAIGLIALVGGTLAVSSDWTSFLNNFNIADYRTEFIETFDSPEDWEPCDETPKTVIAKNNSNVNIKVRLSYEEYWRNKADTENLPLIKDGVQLAEIIFQNQNDWELIDGWYYYKNELEPGQQTNSLFKSVKLSCDANFGKENVCSDTATGRVCQKPSDEYEESTYHLKITVQTMSADAAEYEWGPETLYKVIAKQSKGVDTGVEFNKWAASPNVNGNGVNTLAAHQNDRFPVYYYRGIVDNNVVLFDDICWRILRTAENGAVKMIYSGVPTDGVCPSTGAFTIGSASMAPQNRDTVNIGYMNSGKYYETDFSNIYQTTTSTYYMGKDVTWDGSNYHLVDPVIAYGTASEPDMRFQEYRYHCSETNTTTCSRVYYQYNFIRNGGRAIVLTGGDKIDDVIALMKQNVSDSPVKAAVDTWYEQNITQNRDKLADVVYCNDRSIIQGGLSNNGKGAIGYLLNYGGWMRIGGVDSSRVSRASVDCARKEDSFTVSNTIGNGALKYPIAIATADEYLLAGHMYTDGLYDMEGNEYRPYSESCYDDTCTNQYLRNSSGTWTMTPSVSWSYSTEYINTGSGYAMRGTTATGSNGIRPVIALKYKTYIDSGDGTLANPYILKW